MKRITTAFAIVAAVSVLAGSLAVAEKMEEITVTAKRMLVERPGGHTTGGVPIVDITLSYGVSYGGLDLASHAGASELEKRVNDAAKAACEEISHQRPLVQLTPDDAACTKAAADKAMDKVHELVAAAERKVAK
jgi:UrcA family protein